MGGWLNCTVFDHRDLFSPGSLLPTSAIPHSPGSRDATPRRHTPRRSHASQDSRRHELDLGVLAALGGSEATETVGAGREKAFTKLSVLWWQLQAGLQTGAFFFFFLAAHLFSPNHSEGQFATRQQFLLQQQFCWLPL